MHPGNGYERLLLGRADGGRPVSLTAPGVLEIAYGLSRRPATSEGLRWFTWLVNGDLAVVLSMDATAALVAGRLRAAEPTPPTGAGARRSSTRPEQRAGWLLDLQIAACAWTHGHALATANRRDFDHIARVLASMFPSVPTLEVLDPPRV